MISKTKRFTYHENLETSKLPVLLRIGAKLFFNVDNVIPTKKRVEEYEKYLLECDEIGDEVAQELFFSQSMKLGHQQLGMALTRGIDQVENASSKFKALIKSLEKDPEWLDRDKLEYGAHVCRRLGMDAMIALGDLGLLGGYANPSLSKPLSFTGALKGDQSFDRINETTQFWLAVTKKGGLEIGAKGYQSAIHVRMMHGLIRKRLIQHPKWDSESWGLPINSADSLATNIAFSTVMMVGTTMLGTKHSKKDFESVLHLWLYIGYLMGDKIDWIPKTSEEAMQSLLLIALADNHIPDKDSEQLANDYLEGNLVKEGKLEERLNGYFHYFKRRAYAEFLIPKPLYKRLKLPSSNLSWMLVPLVHVPANFIIQNIVRNTIPKTNELLDREGRKKQEGYFNQRTKKETTFQPKTEFVR